MSALPETSPNRPASFSALVAVIEKCVLGMDQKLGYRGQDRFVLFYYEQRGEEVIWRDSRSYGFSHGAWAVFNDELAPVAELYRVQVGSDGAPAKHVLLMDRSDHRAYFVEKDEAVRFLAAVADGQRPGLGATEGGGATVPAMPASVEVTQETVAKLAYAIWEKKGRLEGRYLDDWLEAEAQLTAAARKPTGNPRRR